MKILFLLTDCPGMVAGNGDTLSIVVRRVLTHIIVLLISGQNIQ